MRIGMNHSGFMSTMECMRMQARISKGGQVSIPASIRRRWATDRVVLEDKGDTLTLRPLPADPIRAARGSLRLPKGLTSEDLRAGARAEEEEATVRRAAQA
jgi:bifunctional DNA-binding transcriptional regulator/antitoxin component of YhaV-PrlF toxin-antitoxin module